VEDLGSHKEKDSKKTPPLDRGRSIEIKRVEFCLKTRVTGSRRKKGEGVETVSKGSDLHRLKGEMVRMSKKTTEKGKKRKGLGQRAQANDNREGWKEGKNNIIFPF